MSRIGRFEIVEQIEENGFNAIYKAYDSELDRYATIKIMGRGAITDQKLVERFGQEVAAIRALKHQSIATIYDFGEHEGRPYLAMELLEGRDLRQLVSEPPLTAVELKLDIAIQVAETLHYAHHRGVIHRGISPATVVLLDSGRVKVVDFGLAGPSIAKIWPGAPASAYLAPEQIRGQKVTAATDVFSLGVVLYELLLGRRPFVGVGKAVLEQIATQPPATPHELRGTAHAWLEAVLLRCLAKDREQRFVDCEALAIRLRVGELPGTSGAGFAAAQVAASADATIIGGSEAGALEGDVFEPVEDASLDPTVMLTPPSSPLFPDPAGATPAAESGPLAPRLAAAEPSQAGARLPALPEGVPTAVLPIWSDAQPESEALDSPDIQDIPDFPDLEQLPALGAEHAPDASGLWPSDAEVAQTGVEAPDESAAGQPFATAPTQPAWLETDADAAESPASDEIIFDSVTPADPSSGAAGRRAVLLLGLLALAFFVVGFVVVSRRPDLLARFRQASPTAPPAPLGLDAEPTPGSEVAPSRPATAKQTPASAPTAQQTPTTKQTPLPGKPVVAPTATKPPPAPAPPAPAPPVAAPPVAALPTTAGPDSDARVGRLLQEGKAYFDAGKWSLPAGANALDSYRAVLALDPGNATARAGVVAICDSYVQRAEEVLAGGDRNGARWRYQRVIELLRTDGKRAGLTDIDERRGRIERALAALGPA